MYSVWPSSQPSKEAPKTIPLSSESPSLQSTASFIELLSKSSGEETEKQADPEKPQSKETEEQSTNPSKSLKDTLLEDSNNRFKRAGEQEKSESSELETNSKPKRQHRGLRCNRCFQLLVRDKDFEYLNGRLYIDKQLLRDKSWEGILVQKGKVHTV